mgnify:CR=1 FL=1
MLMRIWFVFASAAADSLFFTFLAKTLHKAFELLLLLVAASAISPVLFTCGLAAAAAFFSSSSLCVNEELKESGQCSSAVASLEMT